MMNGNILNKFFINLFNKEPNEIRNSVTEMLFDMKVSNNEILNMIINGHISKVYNQSDKPSRIEFLVGLGDGGEILSINSTSIVFYINNDRNNIIEILMLDVENFYIYIKKSGRNELIEKILQ